MVKQLKRFTQKLGVVLLLTAISHCAFSQDAYMNILDTNKNGLFRNFVGIKLFASDMQATGLNQDLQFQYTSNDLGAVYKFQHDMNVTGLSNFYNLGLGLNENLGKHLSLTFFNTSIGYIQHAWDWNVGIGAGYFVSLNEQQTMRLTASMNVYFASITYSLGSYYDSTQLGFIVDGTNIGIAVKNVKYVNDIWSVSPGLEFTYRRPVIDFFAGIYYNYVFSYYEKVNFYKASLSVPNAIYYPNSNPNITPTPAAGNILNYGKYFIQIGVIREFGI